MMARRPEGRVGAPVGGERVGTGWRIFLWAAALFNLVVGIAGLTMAGATTDDRVIGLLVACFGLVYAIVARDARRFSHVLWAGVIGKIGVVVLLVPDALGPPVDQTLAGVLVADALFAIGFFVFLMRRIDSSL
jgi:hypothetical protein